MVGTSDAVEARPDFEAILNGFEFTSPPTPPAAPTPAEAQAKDISFIAGTVAGQCLAIAFLLIIAKYIVKGISGFLKLLFGRSR
jgi:hypothetical protein